MTSQKIDVPQAPADNPEKHQQAEQLSRDINSQFQPATDTFKPGDHTQMNNELKGLGFPDVSVGNDGNLDVNGNAVKTSVTHDDGNLQYVRTGSDGKSQTVTLNLTDHPGLETVTENGNVVQASELDAQGNRHTSNYKYDSENHLQSIETDGKTTKIPSQASDVSVDPVTGVVQYKQFTNDNTNSEPTNVAVSPPDAQGRQTVVSTDTTGHDYDNSQHDTINVQIMQDGKPVGKPETFTNISGAATLNSDGSVTFPTKNDGSSGTTTIDASGQSMEIINAPGGNVSIVRDPSGKLLSYEQNGVSLLDRNGNPLWGLKAQDGEEFQDPKASMKDGQLSYTNDSGVTITMDNKGKPIEFQGSDKDGHKYSVKYNSGLDQWQFHQDDGSDNAWVHVDVPTLNGNGSVSTRQTTGLDSGKPIVMGDPIDGVTQGAGFWTGLATGFVDGMIPGLIPQDGQQAKSAELGAFMGQIVAMADPVGEAGKGIEGFETLNTLYHLSLDANEYSELARNHEYAKILEKLTLELGVAGAKGAVKGAINGDADGN